MGCTCLLLWVSTVRTRMQLAVNLSRHYHQQLQRKRYYARASSGMQTTHRVHCLCYAHSRCEVIVPEHVEHVRQ